MKDTCSDKIPFATKEAAAGAAALARHRYGSKSLKPYVCKLCGDWHLATNNDENEN